jgi:hypothetical protein
MPSPPHVGLPAILSRFLSDKSCQEPRQRACRTTCPRSQQRPLCRLEDVRTFPWECGEVPRSGETLSTPGDLAPPNHVRAVRYVLARFMQPSLMTSLRHAWLENAEVRAPDSAQTPKEEAMLYTLAVVLLILWLLGFVSGYTMGAIIHVLLVVALVLVLVQFLSGRRVV